MGYNVPHQKKHDPKIQPVGLFEKTLHLYNPNIRISMGQQLLDNP
jgi:hypothetical protein